MFSEQGSSSGGTAFADQGDAAEEDAALAAVEQLVRRLYCIQWEAPASVDIPSPVAAA